MNEPTAETATFDPVAEGIFNRIAMGTVVRGDLECADGLIVEGRVEGNVIAKGTLVLAETGVITGSVYAAGKGRNILAGRLGDPSKGIASQVTIEHTVELAGTLVACANITARAMRWYHGAEVDGRIRTHKQAAAEAVGTEAASIESSPIASARETLASAEAAATPTPAQPVRASTPSAVRSPEEALA